MIRVCVHCEEKFDDKIPHNMPGKINECGACAKDVVRYVGMRDNSAKSGTSLNVFRRSGEVAKASAVLQAQNRAGFSPNISIGSTTSTWGQKSDC